MSSEDGVCPHILCARVWFDREHPLFRSHFPESPCVPASLLVRTMLRVLEEAVDLPEDIVLERLRFRRFVRPGECECVIRACRDSARCEMWADGVLACEGRVVWRT